MRMNNRNGYYQKIRDYNLGNINTAVSACKEETIVDLETNTSYPINEYMKVIASDDQMTAYIRLYPESNDGCKISKEEMLSDLSVAKIEYGIDEQILDQLIASPRYCENIVIAKGKPVREGKNAEIEYHFNTDIKLSPKHNDDGSVDFHQLNNISHIKEGDVLAVLHM